MFLTILAVAGVLSGQYHPVRTGDPRLDRILHWRDEFDDEALNLPRGGEYGYPELDSETLGGAHSDVYFPVASAFDRFVIYYPEVDGPPAGILMYEKRSRGKVRVMWRLALVPREHAQRLSGTVLDSLKTDDLGISPNAHLTSAMRKQLEHRGYYAGYSFHPMEGGIAWVVQPNGSSTTPHKGARYWITPEERELIYHPPKR